MRMRNRNRNKRAEWNKMQAANRAKCTTRRVGVGDRETAEVAQAAKAAAAVTALPKHRPKT